MNCGKVSHLLSAYMDGELPGVEHRQIHEHLGRCSACQSEYQGLLQTKRLLASMRTQEPRIELPTLILQRVTEEDIQAATWRPAWFRHFSLWWRQVAPPTPVVALSAGLAVVGMFWLVRVTDADDSLVFTPAAATRSSLLDAPLANTARENPTSPFGNPHLVDDPLDTWNNRQVDRPAPITISNGTLRFSPRPDPYGPQPLAH